MRYSLAHAGRRGRLNSVSWPSVFTLPSGWTATATGLERWLPAAVLDKTANRRSTRPWTSARHHLHQSTTAAGWPSARRSGVLNKHSLADVFAKLKRTRPTALHMSTTRQKTHRGRLRCCTCVIWTSREVAKSGTGTGGLNSNDSGSGACPPTARSLCHASVQNEESRERGRHLMLASRCSSTVLPPLRRMKEHCHYHI